MHDQRDTPLGVAVNGVLAGMTGAIGLSVLVAAGRSVVYGGARSSTDDAAAGITAGQALAEGPDLPPNMNQVTATFVQKIATGIFGASLTVQQQYVAGTLWHLLYGGFWGMVYALIQSSARLPELLFGPVYGLIVWAIGFAWLVPKMKLLLTPTRQRPRTLALALGVHAAYGALVALVFEVLRRRG